MGFFAILKDPSDNPFDVIECHLNLWSLGGICGRRIFVFDVGLRLKAGKRNVSKFQLILPFGTDESGMQDLHDVILNQQVAHLIFGRPVEIQQSTLDYGYGPIAVTFVPASDAHLVKERSSKGVSFWNLSMNPPIGKGTESYIRVRFDVRSLGRAWMWKKSGLTKAGVIVDLRIADVRQAVTIPDCRAFENLILPVKRLNVFLIAPAKLQFRAASPVLHYMRLLEGRTWEPYLGRAAGPEKLVIYEWRNRSMVTTTSPFRAFLDLSGEFGVMSISSLVLTVGLVLLILLIAKSLGGYVVSIYEWTKDLIFGSVYQLGAFTILSIVMWLLRNVGPVRRTLNGARGLFLRFERSILRARSEF